MTVHREYDFSEGRENIHAKWLKKTRSAANLTTLDAFLQEEGKRAGFEAVAIKEVLRRKARKGPSTSLRSARDDKQT